MGAANTYCVVTLNFVSLPASSSTPSSPAVFAALFVCIVRLLRLVENTRGDKHRQQVVMTAELGNKICGTSS